MDLGNKDYTRRSFLKNAMVGAGMASLPLWFAKEATAAEAEVAFRRPKRFGPNDTLNFAVIGPGGSKGGFRQGLGVSRYIHSQEGAHFVAACDVDGLHRQEAADTFGEDTRQYADYREMLAKEDLDAVVIGTPDHWHSAISIAAMDAGLDVYCEKPLTLAIAQGRAISWAATKNGAVFQTGSQQRSNGRFRLACELVRNGRLGKLKKVTTHLPTGPTGGPFEGVPVPDDLDYNMWLGPAPVNPYCEERTHGSFRWWLDYSGGMLTDWGAHHNDIAQWGLGTDGGGPRSVYGTAMMPSGVSQYHYTTFPEYDLYFDYGNGVTLHCTNQGENGVTFEGEEGWIFVSRGRIEASDQALLDAPLPADAVRLYVSDGHALNFLDCIRTRKQPICNAEVGHRSVSVCHMANICLRLGGRQLNWDADSERFLADEEANGMLDRPAREWEE
ncbi:MAG: Gfo/Idh/MocA family oxidoreductase [Armatimonadetes bacterium]|nr:Gfo/Idh/MocA family oxidoreductase [Armatimonadota bacterium]